MLVFITLLGFLLRFSFINKAEGLWNDEYVSWYVASVPFGNGFWEEVFKQCHMPLYYLYLKPFVHCPDTVLRLTSLIPGVIAIPIMYLVGKEFSKRIGYFCATITSVLSFLVYYSQEVRFYSLLFLFSALALLYTIRYIRNDNKKNLFCWLASIILILATHIIGSIFVFFLFLFVIYKKKKLSKKWIFFSILPVILLFPICNVLKMIPSSQWWGTFTYTNILFLFSDYFSPILTNNVNAPPVFFYNKSLALWMTIPMLIAVAGMIRGTIKGLLLVFLATISTMAILASTGKLVFITKYSIEILPILILFTAIGFTRFKNSGTILLIFCLIHLSAFFTSNYVTKIKRNEGHKIVGDILNFQNPQNIIFTYYGPERFYRYANLDGKTIYYINKNNRFEYQDNPSKILSKIPIGQTVSVVFLDSVSFFDEKFLYDNKNIAHIPEMFVTFSSIKNSLLKTLDSNFKDYNVARGGAWSVVKATRFK